MGPSLLLSESEVLADLFFGLCDHQANETIVDRTEPSLRGHLDSALLGTAFADAGSKGGS
jgi:hypothetical protein